MKAEEENQKDNANPVTLPKIISVRSNGFLKMSQTGPSPTRTNSGPLSAATRIRPPSLVSGPQKIAREKLQKFAYCALAIQVFGKRWCLRFCDVTAVDVPTKLLANKESSVVKSDLIVDGETWSVTCVDMGNPHYVTFGTKGEQGMLISLKKLSLQRSQVVGHASLAQKFDLKMLRALACCFSEFTILTEAIDIL